MAYALFVSVLFGISALGCEPAFALRGWARRFVWIFALAGSLAFPTVMALTTKAVVLPRDTDISEELPAVAKDYLSDQLGGFSPSTPLAAPRTVSATTPRYAANRVHFNRQISLGEIAKIAWPASSAAVLLFYGLSWMRLGKATRQFPRVELDGISIRLTQDIGPAVFGLFHPEILVPKWLLEAQRPVRAMSLAHEQQHIVAHDQWMLLVGFLLVACAPWNPVLWWQLRRLRFGIEADCDRRVLACGADRSVYMQALLSVGQHRAALQPGFMALIAPVSLLERRIRILISETGRRSRVLAGSGLAIAIALLALATLLHAPGLAAPVELRKLPPLDTKPAARSAAAIAQSHFPDLFDRHFDGSAVVAVVFNRDGTPRLVNEHVFAPQTTPSDFDMALENSQLGLDSSDDILYRSAESGDFTIGPWMESKNPGRIFIVYEVMKWPHDPSRTRARVQAALEVYDPSLLSLPPLNVGNGMTQVTVFMNNDGTVSQARRQVVESVTEDAVERFAAMGIDKEQLGRRGYAWGLSSTKSPATQLSIDYAWPRRVDDAADVADLNTAWREIFNKYPPRQDTADDGAIMGRYFPDIQQDGRQAVTEVVNGQRRVLTPWILLGRDGRIWDVGRWHNETNRMSVGSPLFHALEASYPGIRVTTGGGFAMWRVKGVPITCVWIAPDSPIQSKAEVDLQRRKDLLVTGAFIEDQPSPRPNPKLPNPVSLQFASAMNFGAPTSIGFGPNSLPKVQVIATEISAQEVSLVVNARADLYTDAQGTPDGWTRTITVRIPYGGTANIDLNDSSGGLTRPVRLVLRPQRLRE